MYFLKNNQLFNKFINFLFNLFWKEEIKQEKSEILEKPKILKKKILSVDDVDFTAISRKAFFEYIKLYKLEVLRKFQEKNIDLSVIPPKDLIETIEICGLNSMQILKECNANFIRFNSNHLTQIIILMGKQSIEQLVNIANVNLNKISSINIKSIFNEYGISALYKMHNLGYSFEKNLKSDEIKYILAQNLLTIKDLAKLGVNFAELVNDDIRDVILIHGELAVIWLDNYGARIFSLSSRHMKEIILKHGKDIASFLHDVECDLYDLSDDDLQEIFESENGEEILLHLKSFGVNFQLNIIRHESVQGLSEKCFSGVCEEDYSDY